MSRSPPAPTQLLHRRSVDRRVEGGVTPRRGLGRTRAGATDSAGEHRDRREGPPPTISLEADRRRALRATLPA
ncbi:MAG: hypothetical protein KC561_21660, partial [Myxococcales bacterium]|nr:hypothetical protein [Myxococcales bacterium]